MCILNYDNKVCGTYGLCRVLSTEVPIGGRARKVKVGYKECRAGEKYKSKPLTEIKIDVQRLVLLVPANKMELLRGPAEKESGREGVDRTED